MSVYWGLLTQDQKEEVLEAIGDEANELYDIYVEAIIEATGLREVHGKEALAAYRARTAEQWAEIRHTDRNYYDEQMREWGHLEASRVRKRALQAVGE